MSIAKEMDEAIVKHFEIPPDVAEQARLATVDLYHGPSTAGFVYLGFTGACAMVGEWCDENLSEVWYDIQSGEVLDHEPEGHYDEDDVDEDDVDEDDVDEESGDARWVPPYWEDYFHADIDTVKRALFDKELVRHI